MFLGNEFCIDIISGYVEFEKPILNGKLEVWSIVYLKWISLMVKGMIKNKDP